MKKNICIFEDEFYKNLLPLVYLRPVYELKCGIFSLKEKIKFYFGKQNYFLHSRKLLQEYLREKYVNEFVNDLPDDEIIFINGRILINHNLYRTISKLKINQALVTQGKIVAAFLDQDNVKTIKNLKSDFYDFENLTLEKIEVEAELINYTWDLINANAEQISKDFEYFKTKRKATKVFRNVVLMNRKNIFISKDSTIFPFVTFDASKGPIIVDKDAKILSHTFIEGPAYIGKNSLVKAHSSIYHGTSIGEFCKVGGEIECTIIHSYSNKQHEGFLGHSYLASWINLGAGTNNSDLKNNYSKVSIMINGERINSGSQFLGVIIGDHTKTAINTKINTGSVFGICCNIFGNDFPPKYLPSFSWGGSESISNYDFNKFIDTAQIVKSRRNVQLTLSEKILLQNIYELILNEKK